jgi:outer membrane receptor protein involved in Fe transport
MRLAAAAFVAAFGVMAAASAGAVAAENNTVDLGEIVVTSTGFGEPRATHTGNISKIDGDEIDFVKAEQPSELLNRVPGVAIEQGSGVEHLTAIRSPVLTGGAGAGSFLYLEDGVPMRAAGFANVNELMDAMTEEAGGIEVVRGPASALYGSNAEHGLINVLSRTPSLVPEAELIGWLGPHGIRNLDGTASTTVKGEGGTSQAFRGSFALNEDGGFRAASGYGQQKTQFRYDFNAPDTTVRATLTTVNLNQETAGYVSGHDAYKDPALYKTNPNPNAYRDAWAIRSAVRIERNLGDGQVIALTPYMRTNGMNFLMHFQPGTPVEENGHWSGGLLSSYEMALKGGHKIILGFDTEYTDGYLREVNSSGAPGGYSAGTHYNYTVKALVLAPYLHTIWQLGPRTQATAGLRFEYTRYDYKNLAGPTSALPYATDRFARPADRNDNFSTPTPKLGLTHVFTDEVTGFVNLARAARAPQTTDLYRLQKLPGTSTGQDPDAIKSEILDSIEVGARGNVHRMRYELAAYFMKKRNFVFRDSNGSNVTDGRTKHVGIEAEFATPLVWNFDLAAAATYARHTYDFDHPSTLSESIVKGDDVDTAPRTIANIRLGYTFDAGLGRAEIEWAHMGAYWMDAANTHRYDGHDLLNLRTEYQLTENLTIFGRIENLLNTRYADRADVLVVKGVATDRYFPGEDRGIYAGATVKF